MGDKLVSIPTKLALGRYNAFKIFKVVVITIAVTMALVLVGIVLIALILIESMTLSEIAELLNIIPLPVYGLVTTLAIAVWVIDEFAERSD